MATSSASVEEARELVAIVDDDASVRRSMDRMIRSFDYRTQVSGSADEFLVWLKARAATQSVSPGTTAPGARDSREIPAVSRGFGRATRRNPSGDARRPCREPAEAPIVSTADSGGSVSPENRSFKTKKSERRTRLLQGTAITTRLVDTVTTPMLLEIVQSGKDRSEQAHHAPVSVGSDSRRLRNLRPGSPDPRAASADRA